MAEAAIVSEAAVAERTRAGRGRFAAVIVVGHAIKHTLTSSVQSALIPEIKLSLGLSATQVGALSTTQQVTGWMATMSAGYLGDRFTRRTGLMLAFSLGMTGSALLIMSVAPGYGVLLLAMLFMGFGPSMFHPPAIGALSRRFADRRSFAISMHGTGGSIGEALGPLVGAGLLLILFWRDALRVEFVPAIVCAVLLWRLLDARNGDPEHEEDHGTLRTYLGSFAGLLRDRTLLLLFLVTGLRAVGQAVTATFLPVYLREDLAYSSLLVGAYIAMGQIAGIGSQPVMGLLADRFGHKAVILPALLCFAAILAIIPLTDGKLQLAIAILALGTFVFSMQSILTSAAVELAGDHLHSTVTSLVYAAGFIGSLSPTLAGILADEWGLEVTFYFSAAVVTLAAIILAFTNLKPNRTPVEV
ncbi:MAG TPA: MFS transporter [Dehalococcoidia bacterium]|jgi:FSR family fosmidomycin resistance protein-like MFS transporter|nr:MFS transporter [Dehalococcoidia bacterium]